MPDLSHWEARLAELARKHGIPAASLAVLADGDVFATATGVLNVETGVEATPDSLFQLGSIGKSYTATVVMRLVEQGRLDLDAPVRDVLPEFRVADPEVTEQVTPRHLLSHTSGIAGEHFEDCGRGDDALERYVAACAQLGQDVPFGVTMSYCNSGYAILGRIIEQLTGKVWDDAMRELLFEPLDLTHTITLPEDALRFRFANGHRVEPGEQPTLTDPWEIPRSLAPAGVICATGEELMRFAKLHIDGGELLERMREPQVELPDRWSTGTHWGLGFILWHWGEERLFGHYGNTSGQSSFLTIEPKRGVAIGLLTNGGDASALWRTLSGELLRELCGIELPPLPEPADDGRGVPIAGRYERHGVAIEIDDALRMTARLVEPLASQMPDDELTTMTLHPSTAGEHVFVGREEGQREWSTHVAFEVDGERYLHTHARAQRKVA